MNEKTLRPAFLTIPVDEAYERISALVDLEETRTSTLYVVQGFDADGHEAMFIIGAGDDAIQVTPAASQS